MGRSCGFRLLKVLEDPGIWYSSQWDLSLESSATSDSVGLSYSRIKFWATAANFLYGMSKHPLDLPIKANGTIPEESRSWKGDSRLCYLQQFTPERRCGRRKNQVQPIHTPRPLLWGSRADRNGLANLCAWICAQFMHSPTRFLLSIRPCAVLLSRVNIIQLGI